jgi:phosphoglycolate phosphatase
MARLLSTFVGYYSQRTDASRPYPGVQDTRRGDRAAPGRGHQQARRPFASGVARSRSAPLFGAIVAVTPPQRKPDAAPALHACRLLGAAPKDALFVGDSRTDVETARNAGCPVVCVRDG